MPYPFRLGCRMCRELARRMVARHFPEPEVSPAPPAFDLWQTKIGPRTYQPGTFFPKHAWGKPGDGWGIHK